LKPFAYHQPTSLEEAVALLAQGRGQAKVLAGGTDLIRDIKARRITPTALVDVSRVPRLRAITVRDDRLVVGAAVTFSQLESSPLVLEHAPVLAQAAAAVGSPQIRNRGTIGGNIANASPSADSVPALLALETTVSTVSSAGGRRLPVEAVLLEAGRSALGPDEIIAEISFTLPGAGSRSGFHKLGRRRALAIARISIASLISLQGNHIEKARIALGAVAPNPYRACAAEEALEGAVATPETVEAAVAAIVKEVALRLGDRVSAPYKREAVVGPARRLLQDLVLQDLRPRVAVGPG
jgi:carbon-monoxide dehydrogenase medium subunit